MSIIDILEDSARQLEADKRTLGVEAAIELHDRRYRGFREARKELQELELLAAERKEESARFFNQCTSDADFKYWSKMDIWSCDEAVALSLGKAPHVVNFKAIEAFIAKSTFAKEYNQRLDMVRRAVVRGSLRDPCVPADFLNWAQEKFETPSSLFDLVFALGGNLQESLLAAQAQISRLEDVINTSNEQRATLNAQFAEYRIQQEGEIEGLRKLLEARRTTEARRPRPRTETTDIIIAAMATQKYKFNPNARRGVVIGEIMRNINAIGHSLDDETVRNILQQACTIVRPGTWER
jgi:hypothetical protein